MARKTVRVEIPIGKPDKLIELGEKTLARHTSDGPNSPLDAGRMTKLGTAVTTAKSKHHDAEDFEAKAQSARQVRDVSLGIAKGQNAHTPDTALKYISYVRDQLLIAFEGNEEALSEYGFDVVVGTAKSPHRKNGNGHA